MQLQIPRRFSVALTTVLLGLFAATTAVATDGLVLWNKLGTDAEVLNSEVGPDLSFYVGGCGLEAQGDCAYGPGVFGNAATLAQNAACPPFSYQRIHNIVLENLDSYLDPERGTIEAWFTQTEDPVPNSHGTYRIFDGPYGLGSGMGLMSFWHREAYAPPSGLMFYLTFGGTGVQVRSLADGDTGVDISPHNGTWIHVAAVWDRAGIDGSPDTMRLYVNGVVVATATDDSWGTAVGSRADIAAGNETLTVPGRFFVDNVKVWDFAKTDFSDRFIEGGEPQCDENDLYVANFNFGSPVVLRFDGTSGDFVDVFAQGGGLTTAAGLDFGPNGNLFVGSQVGAARVNEYDGTTGAFIGTFATGVDARGVLFGPDGNLYVSDASADSVRRFDGATGAFIDNFVASGSGGLNFPLFLAFGPDGNLYVSNLLTPNVLRYDGLTGAFLGPAATIGGSQAGIAFGPDGLLYVVAGEVRRFDGATDTFVDVFADPPADGFARPLAIVFGADGDVYISEGDNPAGRVLRYDGDTSAFLGVFADDPAIRNPNYMILDDRQFDLPPEITCLDPVFGNDPGECGATVDCEDIAFCSDPEMEPVAQTCDPGDFYDVGTTDVEITCEEECNTANDTCQITIEDTIAPQVSCSVIAMTGLSPSDRPAGVDDSTSPGPVDDSYVHARAIPESTDGVRYAVVWDASDECGVDDVTAVIQAVPGDDDSGGGKDSKDSADDDSSSGDTCTNVAVNHMQLLDVKCGKKDCKIKTKGRVWKVKAGTAQLLVTATDAFGNDAQCIVDLCSPSATSGGGAVVPQREDRASRPRPNKVSARRSRGGR